LSKGVNVNAQSKRSNPAEFSPKNLDYDPRLKIKPINPHISFPLEKAEINIQHETFQQARNYSQIDWFLSTF